MIATVIDVGDGAVLGAPTFTWGLEPIDAQLGTDFNGDGNGEILGLFWNPAISQPVVEARDPVTGAKRTSVTYRADHEPVALGWSSSRPEEGVVLARDMNQADRGRLMIKNLVTGTTRINKLLPSKFNVEDLVIAPDFTGTGGFDEALIQASRISDGKGFILVYDTGGPKINFLTIPADQTLIDIDYAVVTGAVPKVVALAIKTSDNQPKIYMIDPLTKARLWGANRPIGYTPVAVRYFATAGGDHRVAVLSQRESDQKPLVSIHNADTGARLYDVAFIAGQVPKGLTIFPDTSLDAGSEPEIGVTMDDGVIRIRDSVTTTLIQTLNAP
jgi:hypothetical protein